MRQTTKLKNTLELHVQRTVDSVRMLAGRIDNWVVQHRDLRAEFNELRDELATNGVATAINRLNEQVFGQSTQKGSNIERAILAMNGVEPRQEASLAAKVDAIIEHLGIEVNVEPEKVVKTPAKVVAKKVKQTKKGKK